MVIVQRFNTLVSTLRSLQQKTREVKPSVVVGYQANYAVYVHENLEARHAPGTQAKYLEQPARQLSPVLGKIIIDAVKGGASLLMALYLAGLRLQRESQLIVPVDTGELRRSAFVEKE